MLSANAGLLDGGITLQRCLQGIGHLMTKPQLMRALQRDPAFLHQVWPDQYLVTCSSRNPCVHAARAGWAMVNLPCHCGGRSLLEPCWMPFSSCSVERVVSAVPSAHLRCLQYLDAALCVGPCLLAVSASGEPVAWGEGRGVLGGYVQPPVAASRSWGFQRVCPAASTSAGEWWARWLLHTEYQSSRCCKQRQGHSVVRCQWSDAFNSCKAAPKTA